MGWISSCFPRTRTLWTRLIPGKNAITTTRTLGSRATAVPRLTHLISGILTSKILGVTRTTMRFTWRSRDRTWPFRKLAPRSEKALAKSRENISTSVAQIEVFFLLARVFFCVTYFRRVLRGEGNSECARYGARTSCVFGPSRSLPPPNGEKKNVGLVV